MSEKKKAEVEFVPSKVKRLPPKEPDTALPVDMVELLDLSAFTDEALELALRDYRIKGVDQLLTDVKKNIRKKEERDALNKYVRMCPPVEKLTAHLLSEHPECKQWFKIYNEKLRKKFGNTGH